MSATAALRVIDALVAGFDEATTALDGVDVLVHDAYSVSDQGYRYSLHVGVEDPASDQAAPSAAAEQEWAHANTLRRDELGTVRSALTLDSGDGDLATLRADAETILAALASWMRTNTDLGEPDLFMAAAITEVEVYQQKDDKGGYLTVVFTTAYRARLSA